MSNSQKNKKILELYKLLYAAYGKPSGQWVMWCKRPKSPEEKEEVIIGAILTQQANWNNVKLALENLKNEKIKSLRDIFNLGKKNKEKLSEIIKPSGFYNQKTNYLLTISDFIIKKYRFLEKMAEVDVMDLRKELLSLKGIGQETADSILLYALEKNIFVIDEYTRRFARKHNLSENFSYNFLQNLFEFNLKKDYRLYQDYHALIVIDGKKKDLSSIT